MLLSIPREEVVIRQKRLLDRLNHEHLDCAMLFNATDIFYLTNFRFHPTERPICLIFAPDTTTHLLVPALEEEHAQQFAAVDAVHTYPEYPGLRHPMQYLKELLVECQFSGRAIGFDSDGYGSPFGYEGPRVSDLLPNERFTSIRRVVEEQRRIKSTNEIELIKESLRWSHLAHRLLQDYSKSGENAIDIENRASFEASVAMLKALGPDYKPHGTYGSNVIAVFRGQVGPISALPHAVTQSVVLRKGDTLVTGADAAIWAYHSELERTMFVEEVTKEQETYFQLMVGAQEVAFATIRPGIPASKVESEVQRYWMEHGVTHLTRHHTGHSLGLMNHEAPFFDLGDNTILQPGMVFSVEPGLYVFGLGGFRHAETVVVTEQGVKVLTYYPRDLASLICG